MDLLPGVDNLGEGVVLGKLLVRIPKLNL
jgi:hypothetical protein